MRITVKDLGDHSGDLARIRVGTPVFIEGPYGRFTADAAGGHKFLLIGAGVGATPLRSLLQDLEEHADVAVLLRGSDEASLVLRDEIAREVERRDGRVWEALGPRSRLTITAEHPAARAMPDLAERDVFICGPDDFTESIAAACRAGGVTADRIHYESFASDPRGALMRRAPIVITATVLGTAGVLLFKPLTTTSVASASIDGSSTTGSSSSTTEPSTSTAERERLRIDGEPLDLDHDLDERARVRRAGRTPARRRRRGSAPPRSRSRSRAGRSPRSRRSS